MKTGLENAEARVAAEEEEADQVSSPARGVSPTTPAAPAGMPDMAGMSEMLRGMGGGGGGMPDIASLMSNPALMGMAQQMMGNGGLENLMRNPAVAGMVSHFLVRPHAKIQRLTLVTDEPYAEWRYAQHVGVDAGSSPQRLVRRLLTKFSTSLLLTYIRSRASQFGAGAGGR